MKILFNIIAALLLVLMFETSTYAQTNAQVDVRARLDELKSNLQLKREGVKTNVQTNIDARRAEMKVDVNARSESNSNGEERRAEVQAKIEARRAELQAEIKEIRQKQAGVRKGYVERKLRQVIVVLTAHIERIENAAARLKARGKTTTEAEASIADAKASLQVSIENLDKLGAMTIEDNNKETIEIAREYAKAAEESLKKTRASLVAAITNLKKNTDAAVEAKAEVESSANAEAAKN